MQTWKFKEKSGFNQANPAKINTGEKTGFKQANQVIRTQKNKAALTRQTHLK
jgi:hypothetical protein